ncbi:MAG: hypothetical protein EPN45_08020 [Rhizobiaceae bacterium]|nr:MAG: hypothetical protein EPN45_08020 [Rhizobiaceae bacterium]
MQQQTEALEGLEIKGIDQALMFRVFYGFAALALLSLAILIAGHWLSRFLSNGDYTEDATLHEIVIGNNVLSVPSNAIRFSHARRDGEADRLDLYLHWPDMKGYTAATRDDFNDIGGRKAILFLTFEPRLMPLDMSGRFDPIYRTLIAEAGRPGENGLEFYDFKPDTGYAGEELAVAKRAGEQPFVARCLTGPSAAQSLAPCERDIAVGNRLTLLFRFPRNLLGSWQQLDKAVAQKASAYLKTAS